MNLTKLYIYTFAHPLDVNDLVTQYCPIFESKYIWSGTTITIPAGGTYTITTTSGTTS